LTKKGVGEEERRPHCEDEERVIKGGERKGKGKGKRKEK
jgi:hypothetical protein